MKRAFLLAVLVLQGVVFAFKDSDLDGVEDSVDRCPNTPILELVDSTGCPLRKGRFYLKIGGGFLKEGSRETLYSTASVAYSYKSVYLSLTGRYYIYDSRRDPDLGDTTLFAGYSKFLGERLHLFPGLRISLPTGSKSYSSDGVDLTPSVVVDLFFDRFDLFLYSGYTFRGNSNFKDTFSLSLGGGYNLTEDLYTSLSYDVYESPVRSGTNRYISLFTLYDISYYYYLTLTYSRGINKEATDHTVTIRLGIRF